MAYKNWLFEAALNAGKLEIATSGFRGVRNKTDKRTRVHLEATALEAICHLRQGNRTDADALMEAALSRDTNIRGHARRREFKRRMVDRFEKEVILAELRGHDADATTSEQEVHDQSIKMLHESSEDEIFTVIATRTPMGVGSQLERVDQLARKALPSADRRLLPPAGNSAKQRRLGERVFDSLKLVFWDSLCNPKGDNYEYWFKKGFSAFVDKKYLAAAVLAALTTQGIGAIALAAPVVALIIKMGIDTVCRVARPDLLMTQ